MQIHKRVNIIHKRANFSEYAVKKGPLDNYRVN